MKVLIIHNAYEQRGGEDTVVAAEAQLLEERGHEVVFYRRHNDELRQRGRFAKMSTGIEATWAQDSYHALKKLLLQERPHVAHFHNTLPLISPAGYYACSSAGVPVVQTLHNYRLLCPGGQFLRNGQVCEACLGRNVPWPGVAHACYRESRPATAAVCAMLTVHRVVQTWRRKVDVYVALSEFAKNKFIQGGLPAERIVVKPNSVDVDCETRKGGGEYALFIGRLSEEKGLRVLIEAWKRRRERIPLRIVGDGPLRRELEQETEKHGLLDISFWGRLPPREAQEQMRGARFLLFPSIWYEGFPMTVAEAFACEVPVVCSRLGALEEIVQDRATGLHFHAGNPEDLAAKVAWAWTHPAEMKELGRAARRECQSKYAPERNYQALVEIYKRANCSMNSATLQHGVIQ
jgi:glycosyltransferase involved in cell wall biosynthesis